jgi:hypothetical protein
VRTGAIERLTSLERDTVIRTALVILMAGTAALLVYAGRDLTFHVDEWGYAESRRAWTTGAFLEPQNGHLSLLRAIVFKTLYATVGLRHYVPYQLVGVAAHLLCVSMVFAYARRRIGSAGGFVAAVVVLLLGSGWYSMLFPFTFPLAAAISAGLAALMMLDRNDRRGDAAACALLVVAVVTSSAGLPFVVAAFVDIALRPGRLKRLPVVEVPLALYVAWRLLYGTVYVPGGTVSGNITKVPQFVAEAAAGAVGGVVGLAGYVDRHVGAAAWTVLVLAALVVAGVAVRRRSLPIRFVAFAAAALTFWTLAGLTRAQIARNAGIGHYVYVGGIFVVLMAVELARGSRLRGWPTTLALAAALCATVAFNMQRLFEGSEWLREWSTYVSAELGALELAGPSTAPDYRPDRLRAPEVVSALYFNAVRELGSPADDIDELEARPEQVRVAADGVLVGALAIAPKPTGARRESCIRSLPTSSGVLDVRATGAGVVIHPGTTPAELRVRRFAASFPRKPLAVLRTTSEVSLPQRGVARPWRVRITASAPVAVCELGRT